MIWLSNFIKPDERKQLSLHWFGKTLYRLFKCATYLCGFSSQFFIFKACFFNYSWVVCQSHQKLVLLESNILSAIKTHCMQQKDREMQLFLLRKCHYILVCFSCKHVFILINKKYTYKAFLVLSVKSYPRYGLLESVMTETW